MNKKIFKGSVMLNPVPVTLISTKDIDGKPNVFTVAWIGTACTKPPIISVGIRPERLSYKNIVETGEFVVNLPSRDLVKAVDFCGVRSGRDTDKFEKFNLSTKPGISVDAPIITDCPVNIECKLKDIVKLGSHDLFLGEVVNIQVDENLMDNNGKIHFENAELISYCHGEYYDISKKSIGKFGYSVQKKKSLSKTNYNKKSSKTNR